VGPVQRQAIFSVTNSPAAEKGGLHIAAGYSVSKSQPAVFYRIFDILAGFVPGPGCKPEPLPDGVRL